MPRATLIAGLGFGDEGKGTIVDYLCAQDMPSVVVRYNGGAQAAHNVIDDSGRHHTFAQFGSGTLQGVPTFLSRFMFVDPLSMVNEAAHLREIGINNPWDMVWVDRQCPIITPFHKLANMYRELRRGASAHGTCGMGVGEAVEDWMAHPGSVPLIGDLENPSVFAEKLRFVKELKHEQFPGCDMSFGGQKLDIGKLVDRYASFARNVKMVNWDFLAQIRTAGTHTIFEGAQGVLLDQDFGFQPHTTWSNVTFDNAYELLNNIDYDGDIVRMGVTRTYQTRHGAGPMPTEATWLQKKHLNEPHNSSDNAQGSFRRAALDFVLMRYAVAVLQGIDYVAITHADKAEDSLNVVREYDAPLALQKFCDAKGNILVNRDRDYDYQCRLTGALYGVEAPNLYCGHYVRGEFPLLVEAQLQRFGGYQVTAAIESFGPQTKHKRDLCKY